MLATASGLAALLKRRKRVTVEYNNGHVVIEAGDVKLDTKKIADTFPGLIPKVKEGSTSGCVIQSGDMVYLRTRAFDAQRESFHYLNSPSGTGDVRVVPGKGPDPDTSDEIWWIEKRSGGGQIQSGDMVYLRTRVFHGGNKTFHKLNAPGGIGPSIRMVPGTDANPDTSDEIWWIEKRSGGGQIQSGDMVYLRTRVFHGGNKTFHKLNAPGGVGPSVRVVPGTDANPDTSDEIWWIQKRLSDAPIPRSRCDRHVSWPILGRTYEGGTCGGNVGSDRE